MKGFFAGRGWCSGRWAFVARVVSVMTLARMDWGLRFTPSYAWKRLGPTDYWGRAIARAADRR